MTAQTTFLALLAGASFIGACGDNHGSADAARADARTIDARTDAAIDAAPLTPVSLLAFYNGQVVSSATVLFRDAAGGVISTKQTDAKGAVSERVPAGGSVSLFVGAAPPALLGGPNNVVFTFVGVQPGDELRIEDPRTGLVAPVNKTITVPVLANTAGYVSSSLCSNSISIPTTNTSTISVSTEPACAQTNFFVEARSAQFTALGSFFATNLTTTGAAIDLSANTYKAPKPLTVNVSNVPATVSNITTSLRDNDGAFYMPSVNSAATINVTGTSGTATIAVPDIGTAMEARLQYSSAGGFQSMREQTTIANVAVDLTANSLPTVAAPTVNIATNTVSWSESGGSLTADGVRAFVNVNRTPLNFSHIIVAPHLNTSLTIPTLPAPYTNYNLKATDVVNTNVQVSKFSGGYHSSLRYLSTNGIMPAGAKLFISGR